MLHVESQNTVVWEIFSVKNFHRTVCATKIKCTNIFLIRIFFTRNVFNTNK